MHYRGGDEYRLTEERQAVFGVLSNADGPLAAKDIAEALDKKSGDTENVGCSDASLRNGDFGAEGDKLPHVPRPRPGASVSDNEAAPDTSVDKSPANRREEMHCTGIIRSERRVFELAREHFGKNGGTM